MSTNQIGNLKQRIEADKGITAESMKIIFKGKTTKDDESLEKLGLKETDFLVVMSQVSVSQLLRRNHLPSPKLKKRKRPLNLNLNKNLPTNPQKRRKMVFNHPQRVHKPKSTT